MTDPRNTSWSGQRTSFPKPIARRILRRDPECVLQYDGCTHDAVEADHIVGVADAIAAGWELDDIHDESNGQGVCKNCHAPKTEIERTRGLERAAQQRPKQRPKPKHPGLL